MLFRLKRIAIISIIRRRWLKKRPRRYWVHPLNRLRDQWGEHLKFDEMKSKYPEKFFDYTRMSPEQFDKLLDLLTPLIPIKLSNFRETIEPRIGLYVTLRYLSTGDSLKTIAMNYSMGISTVWTIVRRTCPMIWEVLSPRYLPEPTEQDWKDIANSFEQKWNFPHCVGAIDGKHVVIQAPDNSGSIFFNYKKTFSLVLLAVVDANYRFTVVDIGAYGKQSDGGIFSASEIGKQLNSGTLPLPPPAVLPRSQSKLKVPYLVVGDDAFPLSRNMQRPYSGKYLPQERTVFNYRLSRARRISENAFGIMASRFRIFRRTILAAPHHVENIVKSCVALHNYLRTEELNLNPTSRLYCPPGYADDNGDNGDWRNEPPSVLLQPIQSDRKHNYTISAGEVRDELTRYFSNEGSVNWQLKLLGLSPAPENK